MINMYRVAQKKKHGTAYFPKYVDTITGITVWGHFSWEKLYQDTNFGSVVCFLDHIMWDNANTPNFSFSA